MHSSLVNCNLSPAIFCFPLFLLRSVRLALFPTLFTSLFFLCQWTEGKLSSRLASTSWRSKQTHFLLAESILQGRTLLLYIDLNTLLESMKCKDQINYLQMLFFSFRLNYICLIFLSLLNLF